jgi:hypothetical protein
MVTRAADILASKGFATAIGTNVFLAKKPNKKLPAVVISPGRESNAPEYGENILTMEVDVSGFMAFGTSDPELIAEKILADLIEAFSATEIVYAFTTGESEIEVGDTITGEDSGATGYVVAVAVSSGTWAGDNAAGTITVRRETGNGFAAEVVTVGGVDSATITGATGYDPEALATGGLAESIVYTEGGAEDWPEDGETVAGSSARFAITYRTKTGNPYSQ